MKMLRLGLICLGMCTASFAGTPLQDIIVNAPQGWKLAQEGRTDETLFQRYRNGTRVVHFYAKRAGWLDMKSYFANGAEVVEDVRTEKHGPFQWNVIRTSKASPQARGAKRFVSAFHVDYRGKAYLGYARAESADAARADAAAFLDQVSVQLRREGATRSLTGPDYSGKKYYLGWGAAMQWDPDSMQNEVKYDVNHTHDIFTKDIGGGYIGSTLVGYDEATGSAIQEEWRKIKEKITAEDMFVQYSSGHGGDSGLSVGVDWNQVSDNALSYPAREIIIFTMSCHSGNLVNAFNRKKSQWSDFQDHGRTLFVMASSKASENSSGGPGTDSDESGGPEGSAGSAFGHALWKSLIGYADGYVDGVKDGFVSLEEIREYATSLTKKVGGHTPQTTGAYEEDLIMNRVPNKAFLAQLERDGGTENMSDEAVMQKVRELDAALSVRR